MSDRTLRRLAGLAVLLVAAIAATVSYQHIYLLAVALGQPRLAAVLMPLSVDGAVAAASIALLSAARTGAAMPGMAQLMLALGVLATLGANAYSGSSHGIAGMALACWPAVAFCGSTETALSMVRRSARAATQPDVAPSLDTVETPARPALSIAWPPQRQALQGPDTSGVARPSQPDSGRSIERTRTGASAQHSPDAAAVEAAGPRPSKRTKPAKRAAVIVAKSPDISGAELGRKLGVSERTGRRILADLINERIAA